jgi:hypothetical protein
MTCQILHVNLPTCRTAMRQKTAARTMIAIYVEEYFPGPGDEPWHRASKEYSWRKKCSLEKSLL